MKYRLLLFLLIVILGIGILLRKQPFTQNIPSATVTEPTGTKSEVFKTVEINEIPMQMNIPEEYIFSKEALINLTTNEPLGVTFTVQNYSDNPTQVDNPYQLYGIYQSDTGVTTAKDFAQSDFLFVNGTQKSFTVDQLPAISGVISGERGRYTIYILVNGHLLTLAADGSSKTHKEITDSIVKSIQLN